MLATEYSGTPETVTQKSAMVQGAIRTGTRPGGVRIEGLDEAIRGMIAELPSAAS